MQDTEELMAKAARSVRDSGILERGLRGLGALGAGSAACSLASSLVIPALLVLGVGAVTLTTVEAGTAVGRKILVAGGVLVLVVAAARRWRWPRRCACDDAAIDCSSDAGEPIACTLDGHGIQRRLDEFRQVFERAYIAGEHLEDGVRWRFRATPGLEEELLALADREHRCCRFFRFQIRPTGEEVWWDTRVENRDAQPVLEEFFALPSRMTERDSVPRDVPAFWPGRKSPSSTSDR